MNQTVDLNDYKRVYFIGAGGIGMAALERYFLAMGKDVAGYDRTPSALTDALISEGVAISYDDSLDAIPEAYRQPEGTLAVLTPAVPVTSQVRQFFEGDKRFTMLKRAAVLGAITRGSKALCFAGTHGKTTTSSMAAHLMHSTKADCNAFLGGILRGYESNLILAPASEYSVAEADEYDRSFHQLTPWIAVINATDPDHLDIYGTEEAYLESFAHFTELVRPGGALLLHTGMKLKPRPGKDVRVYTFGRESGDFHVANIRRPEGTVVFDIVCPDGTVITDVEPGVPVDINIDNTLAAVAACWLTGEVDADTIRKAMCSFPGVERRFQFHLRQPGRVVIDDYAHHPDELRQSIASVRALYPDRHLTVAFQPHLYSRTRDFAPEFAEALSLADSVVLADIYPARELPIPGVTSQIIFDRITCTDKMMISKEQFVDTMKNRNFEILLTAGAGDLSFEVPKLCRAIVGDQD